MPYNPGIRDVSGELYAQGLSGFGHGIARGMELRQRRKEEEERERRREEDEQKSRARKFRALQEYADAAGIFPKEMTTPWDLETLEGKLKAEGMLREQEAAAEQVAAHRRFQHNVGKARALKDSLMLGTNPMNPGAGTPGRLSMQDFLMAADSAGVVMPPKDLMAAFQDFQPKAPPATAFHKNPYGPGGIVTHGNSALPLPAEGGGPEGLSPTARRQLITTINEMQEARQKLVDPLNRPANNEERLFRQRRLEQIDQHISSLEQQLSGGQQAAAAQGGGGKGPVADRLDLAGRVKQGALSPEQVRQMWVSGQINREDAERLLDLLPGYRRRGQ